MGSFEYIDMTEEGSPSASRRESPHRRNGETKWVHQIKRARESRRKIPQTTHKDTTERVALRRCVENPTDKMDPWRRSFLSIKDGNRKKEGFAPPPRVEWR